MNRLPLTDCKAFSFEKIRRLQADGITAIFTVVRTETGDYHAIAVVDGVYALDSRYPDVMTVDELRRRGYSISPR